jgi:hypothetical protein
MRCLAKDPDQRHADAPSLAADLLACADASNWSPEHAATWWQTHEGVDRNGPGAERQVERIPVAYLEVSKEIESLEAHRRM